MAATDPAHRDLSSRSGAAALALARAREGYARLQEEEALVSGGSRRSSAPSPVLRTPPSSRSPAEWTSAGCELARVRANGGALAVTPDPPHEPLSSRAPSEPTAAYGTPSTAPAGGSIEAMVDEKPGLDGRPRLALWLVAFVASAVVLGAGVLYPVVLRNADDFDARDREPRPVDMVGMALWLSWTLTVSIDAHTSQPLLAVRLVGMVLGIVGILAQAGTVALMVDALRNAREATSNDSRQPPVAKARRPSRAGAPGAGAAPSCGRGRGRGALSPRID